MALSHLLNVPWLANDRTITVGQVYALAIWDMASCPLSFSIELTHTLLAQVPTLVPLSMGTSVLTRWEQFKN